MVDDRSFLTLGKLASCLGHLGEHNVAKRLLRMVGNADGGLIAFDGNPFVFLGEIDRHQAAPLR